MVKDKQILHWLKEVSEDEQDFAGSVLEDESVNDTALNSFHDSDSEIEEFEDSQDVSESLGGCYLTSNDEYKVPENNLKNKSLSQVQANQDYQEYLLYIYSYIY
ncbi:unnamed protein product [Euphydryas editha]|uniref:Uncharacterized protein n=1 Tax=Euphydryas editha TaxID=104508 RepID=A0AAU9TXE7_EUPED|nr:unnamed protein product [Euphydryas editha]